MSSVNENSLGTWGKNFGLGFLGNYPSGNLKVKTKLCLDFELPQEEESNVTTSAVPPRHSRSGCFVNRAEGDTKYSGSGLQCCRGP